MDGDSSTGRDPRRIEVDPGDVRVVSARTWSYGAPPPMGGEPPPWLRRHRTKFALALAVVELLALGLAPGNPLRAWLVLLVVAIAAVALHVVASRVLPYSVRQITWAIALGQALVALFPIFLVGSVVVIAILIAFALLVGLALLLGDRR